jgi:DNA-binding MarR family transcriptional regulator
LYGPRDEKTAHSVVGEKVIVEMTRKPTPEVTPADYQALSDFRYLLRCFLEFSEKAAREAGIQPRQHQALLAIKAFEQPVTIGILAERLRIRHHSAVELVDRLVEAGLVVRVQDTNDNRKVILHLTARAEAYLKELSAVHLDELSRIEPVLTRILTHGKGRYSRAEGRRHDPAA